MYGNGGKKFDWKESTKISKNVNETPEESLSICANGIPLDCDEKKLGDIVEKNCGIRPAFVKIVRDFKTKTSKGYGYIDFETIPDSKTFMDTVDGEIFVDNTKVQLVYSKNPNEQKDWICDACTAQNFGFRQRCFKCSNIKTDKCKELDEKIKRGVGASKIKTPTCELLIRGLSPLTNEENIHRVFDVLSNVVNVRIIRDHITRQSKCYGFVEFKSVEDAKIAHKALSNEGIFIEGRKISGEYAKRQHLIGNELKTLYPISYVHRNYKKPLKNELDDNNIAVKGARLRQKAEAEGYIFDINSGYYFNASNGMYLDLKSGLYYCSQSNEWMKLNEMSGEFEVVTEESMKAEKLKEIENEKKVKNEVEVEGTGKGGGGENSIFGNFDLSIGKSTSKSWDDIINDDKGGEESIFGSFSISKKNDEKGAEKGNLKIESQTIGKNFIPNPRFQEMMQIVDQKESEKELKKLQKKVKKVKMKNLKRKFSESFPKKAKEENEIGKKLMKKMGWNGKGLGLRENGLINPLDIKVRDQRAGVGFDQSFSYNPNEGKKSKNSKKMKKRFEKRL